MSKNNKNIIIPLPSHDFDPTEVSISWKVLTDAGFQVTFATENGKRGHCDPLMISGEGLDPWGWIPVLKKVRLIGLFLRGNKAARTAYQQLENDTAFLKPVRFDALKASDYDGMVLPGGHASGMKQYLENEVLQRFVVQFFEDLDEAKNHKPIAAVCHGVVLAARSTSKQTQRSVLFGKKTTSLTWALEKSAWDLTKYFARFWGSTYYRTYMESKGEALGHWSVESEVTRALKNKSDFIDVPKASNHHFIKTSGLIRDTLTDDRAAWVVQDGNYISARWPGDVHTMAKDFVNLVNRCG